MRPDLIAFADAHLDDAAELRADYGELLADPTVALWLAWRGERIVAISSTSLNR